MAQEDATRGTAGSDDGRPAGGFVPWLAGMQAALAGDADSDVPCDGCTACCRASQFVHISPDETDTLAHVPAELLFPAPGLPDGHVLMGYDEAGRCPMLVGEQCSIYDHRPRTCRTFDCRVFAAAGVLPEEPAKADVAARAATWRFDVADADDERARDAVRAAAAFVVDHGDLLPGGSGPRDATGIAVLAVEVHEAFLDAAAAPGPSPTPARSAEAVRVLLSRRRSDRR
jgi:Fe-S-cluster containining protein